MRSRVDHKPGVLEHYQTTQWAYPPSDWVHGEVIDYVREDEDTCKYDYDSEDSDDGLGDDDESNVYHIVCDFLFLLFHDSDTLMNVPLPDFFSPSVNFQRSNVQCLPRHHRRRIQGGLTWLRAYSMYLVVCFVPPRRKAELYRNHARLNRTTWRTRIEPLDTLRCASLFLIPTFRFLCAGRKISSRAYRF